MNPTNNSWTVTVYFSGKATSNLPFREYEESSSEVHIRESHIFLLSINHTCSHYRWKISWSLTVMSLKIPQHLWGLTETKKMKIRRAFHSDMSNRSSMILQWYWFSDMSSPYPASWLHVTFVKTRVPVLPQRFTCEGCESTSFVQRTKEVSWYRWYSDLR